MDYTRVGLSGKQRQVNFLATIYTEALPRSTDPDKSGGIPQQSNVYGGFQMLAEV